MFTDNIPSSEKVYQKSYRGFKGVDFSSAVTEVDDGRSPYCENMISLAGIPQKRCGYADIGYQFGGRINGIHSYITSDNVKKLVVHAGNKLYELVPTEPLIQPNPPTSYIYIAVMPEEAEPKEIYTDMYNARSVSFGYGGKLYILDGKTYIVYDGETAKPVQNSDDAYVPTTMIAGTPKGGGEDFEEVNRLCDKRINRFAGTAEDTTYQLDTENISGVYKVEVMNSSGVFEEVTNYTVNAAAGQVVFGTAPGVSPVTGEDNVYIYFSKNVPGYADAVNKCTISTFYGMNSDLRVFVSGNPDNRNYDYYSATNDPTYFPDTNYSVVGSENCAIMGYLKQYDELVIVKQKGDQDASIYFRSVTLGSDNKLLFTVRQGLAGVGAVSRYAFANLYDDNIFLTSEGVFGLDTSSETLQRSVQNRSEYVNGKLCAEPGLYEAFGLCAKGYYYLFINGRAYVADSKQRNTNTRKSFGYEWYYWTNIPARVAAEYEGEIYIGADDGKIHKFKTEDKFGMKAFSDNGSAYPCVWTTKMDTLSDCSSYKTIPKGNVGVLFKPSAGTAGEIFYITEEEKKVRDFSLTTVFDFGSIDFDNFSFGSSVNPTFIATNSKVRKAKMFQIAVKNNTVDTDMGIFEIKFNYIIKNRIK